MNTSAPVVRRFPPNLWLFTYPLRLLGIDLMRNVAVMRLVSGDLVIHSTAPFSETDVANITALGRPAWLVEAMLDHDTFAPQGHAAFPRLPFLAPEGFTDRVHFPTDPILPEPTAWGKEIEAVRIEGNPAFDEYAVFHRPSRTLIVADLVFNFPQSQPLLKELLLRVAIGGQHEPGMSIRFKLAIKDEAAFRRSIARLLEWDFDRVIVGHGTPIETGGREKLRAMFGRLGYLSF